MESFGAFLLIELILMSGEEIAVCCTWDDEIFFNNRAKTGGNRFIIKVWEVGLDVFSETVGFDFRVNQIIIFY